ncbi:CDP-alcohol phosphatidyltransferase family protein [Immundisolibacter sp.]|uniref:CDP-alcohol phosphatidyltransferase family protein n=1 Tax=Immundisolibacter sp. TaxID=1934948 RepID=UPI003561A92F
MLDSLRERFEGPLRERLEPVVQWLAARQMTPNQVTLAALGLSLLAALCIGSGWLRLGALVLIVASLGDLVDGMLARATDQSSPFGAFFDSTLDRLSEGAVLAAVAYQFAIGGHPLLVATVVLALLGSLLVSYTRARAEALGIECTVGLMSRAERTVLLIAGLLLGLLAPAVVLLAVLSLYTVGQRVQCVREALDGRD